MGIAGPRFFGFVIGGALPAALAANWLASAWDQNAAFNSPFPAGSVLESVALEWMRDIFGLPAGTAGAFVTGATMANFSALAAARHAVLAGQVWDVEADGLFGAPPITVVVGEEAHPTLIKALGLLGLGRNRVVRVPVDGQGRMRADSAARALAATIVCAQAGNVNTGAFDPFAAIAERDARGRRLGARRWRVWVVGGRRGARAHLPRAWAGRLVGDRRAQVAQRALRLRAGVRPRCRRPARRDGITADYLPAESDVRNPSDFTPELSRRARGVDVWAALRSLGRSGLAELVERNCRQAERFAEGLSAAGLRVLNDVVLNQVLVSFGEPADAAGDRGVQDDGTCWCGGTVWQGRTAMRISVSSWATTDDDVERSLVAILRAAQA